jgi:putative ABC transport system substrate-binding protein
MAVIRRRDFIRLLGGAAAWPAATRAQPAMPVVGLLSATSAGANRKLAEAFRHGLKEMGFVEGENVAIESRWADDQIGRLPALAAELVERGVAVIAAGSPAPVFAAKAATSTIPIVFMIAGDPVKLGLVGSLARPNGNLTGINFFLFELAAKRLEFLRQLVPAAGKIALLISPANAAIAEATLKDVEGAARAMSLQIRVLKVDTGRQIEEAFATFSHERPDALMVSSGPFFTGWRVRLAQLAEQYAVPAMYAERQHVEDGGLMSYGTNLADTYRQAGVYAGRILKGAKPAELPVEQSTKFELVINHRSARRLGLSVPPTLLAIADEVIE